MKTIPTQRALTSVDLSLPGNRALRVSLFRDAAGEPESLAFVTGWVSPFRRDRGAIELPGHLLPELRAALDALEAE